MAGHSKWSNIKRQKSKTDAQRAKIFTKIGREIMVAVKSGGPDPVTNSRLRDIIAKAKANNMPNDNINRSIKRASGETNAVNYEPITYEGYGPSGTAFIVECLTDNKNRTAAEIRYIFDRGGGSMGTSGCVSYLFESKGIIVIEKTKDMDDDQIMMAAIECGAEDFLIEDEVYEISTIPTELNNVKSALEDMEYKILNAEIDKIPATYIDIGPEDIAKVQKMLDNFEENDDVQQVYHNVNLPDEPQED